MKQKTMKQKKMDEYAKGYMDGLNEVIEILQSHLNVNGMKELLKSVKK